jgi:hypothetical protein
MHLVELGYAAVLGWNRFTILKLRMPQYLTPKIPCVFLPNSVVSHMVGKINFSKTKV